MAEPDPVVGWQEGMLRHDLGGGLSAYSGTVPDALLRSGDEFEQLWDLHPAEYHSIRRAGRQAFTNRWQQAYAISYEYSGSVNVALDTPAALTPFLEWCRGTFDARMNGLLLNWYDLAMGHNIGRHRDDTAQLVEGVSIVTLSFGATQVFRLKPVGRHDRVDLAASDGTVITLPYDTNLAWTHEIPRPPASASGRRISITARAFQTG